MKRSRLDQIIELLADEVAERLSRREAARRAAAASKASRPETDQKRKTAAVDPARRKPQPVSQPTSSGRSTPALAPEKTTEPKSSPPVQGVPHAAPLMRRLAIGLLAMVVLINIPFTQRGKTLATAMPYRATLAIRDGLVVKEEDDPEFYVYRDSEFRWISSLEAFELLGYDWRDVHVVEDGYLDDYEIGEPIQLLVKCQASPHIYLLEEGEKRWIRDIETFDARGYAWEDIRFVSCGSLRDFPDGETIPPGSGPPPVP